MCFSLYKKKEILIPDWITQTRKVVAQAERDAAAIHYTWMILIEDGTLPVGHEEIGGNYVHHEYWWRTHLEAAWYMENCVHDVLTMTGSEVGALMCEAI